MLWLFTSVTPPVTTATTLDNKPHSQPPTRADTHAAIDRHESLSDLLEHAVSADISNSARRLSEHEVGETVGGRW